MELNQKKKMGLPLKAILYNNLELERKKCQRKYAKNQRRSLLRQSSCRYQVEEKSWEKKSKMNLKGGGGSLATDNSNRKNKGEKTQGEQKIVISFAVKTRIKSNLFWDRKGGLGCREGGVIPEEQLENPIEG